MWHHCDGSPCTLCVCVSASGKSDFLLSVFMMLVIAFNFMTPQRKNSIQSLTHTQASMFYAPNSWTLACPTILSSHLFFTSKYNTLQHAARLLLLQRFTRVSALFSRLLCSDEPHFSFNKISRCLREVGQQIIKDLI